MAPGVHAGERVNAVAADGVQLLAGAALRHARLARTGEVGLVHDAADEPICAVLEGAVGQNAARIAIRAPVLS